MKHPPTKTLQGLLLNVERALPLASDILLRGHLKQLRLFLGPAFNAFIMQAGKGVDSSRSNVTHEVQFDWLYLRNDPVMRRLYEAANTSQWNAESDIDWSLVFDPMDSIVPIIPDSYCPGVVLPEWQHFSAREKAEHRQSLLSFMLSQILHGEQGALFGAAQIMQGMPGMAGKLLGASQVADEARHVDVFHRYLSEKLGKSYEINENLFVLVQAIMSDSRWDVKFLGMQIMIEGFGLGAFTMIRNIVTEPTLKQILKLVISDEARHVNFGVTALERFYREELSERERREREDLAFEISLLLQRRFLAHEIHQEYWTHRFNTRQWEAFVMDSQLMSMFRSSMFRLIIPNLKRIGLLSDRIKPGYEKLGVLHFENAPVICQMSADEILAPVS